MIAGQGRFWDFFKLSGLTVMKDVFSSVTAGALSQALGGRTPAQVLGLDRISGSGSKSGGGSSGTSALFGGSALISGTLTTAAPALAFGLAGSKVPGPRALKAGLAGGGALAGGVILGGAGVGASFVAFGAALTNPVSAAILGAAVGIPALISLFTKGAKDKAKQKIQGVYGVNVTDNNLRNQIVGIAKTQAGGNLDLVIHSPQVRDLIQWYSMSTGRGGSGGFGNFPRGISLVQRSGRDFINPQFQNATPFTFAGAIPTAPVSVNRDRGRASNREQPSSGTAIEPGGNVAELRQERDGRVAA